MMTPRAWILRIAESKSNYWMTYVMDVGLMVFFLAWDVVHFSVALTSVAVLFVIGAATWTLSEYLFHRWLYHLGFEMARAGHEKHHQNPKGYLAVPWFFSPILFVPPQQLIAGWFGVHGASAFFAGWFAGLITYSYLHHCLHHYNLTFAWYRHLQSQHRLHHAFPETNYGVTTRYWDRVFRTEFRKGSPRES